MTLAGSKMGPAALIPWSQVMRVKGESLFALALFGIFSFGTYHSTVMNNPSGGPSDVGAAFFPFWVCIFIQMLTAFIFVKSVITDSGIEDDGINFKKRFVLFVGILLLLFLYILIMDAAGFVFSSILFLVLVHQLLVFSETGRPSPLKGMAFSVIFFSAVTTGLFFLFNTVFKLALP
jgi:hypothetical protein